MLSIVAGRVDISPRLPMAIGINGRVVSRCDGALEANVVILDSSDGSPIVLVQIDTMFVDARFQAALCRRIGIEAGRLMILASHTHSAPMLTTLLPPPAMFDAGYADEVETKIAALAQQLLASARRRATARLGCVVADLNVNRRKVGVFLDLSAAKRGRLVLRRRCFMQPNARGPVDRALRALRFDDESGQAMAIVWGYAAHPSRQPDAACVSADFPGFVRERLREQFGEHISVLYVPGLAGSTAPRIPFSIPHDLGGLARWALPYLPYSPAFTGATYNAWCASLAEHAGRAVSEANALDAAIPSCRAVRSAPIFVGQADTQTIALEMQALSFGPEFVLAATSGETMIEWTEVWKEFVGGHVWMSGYLAGRPTYVPTRAVIKDGGYEAEGFLAPFGMSGKFVPDLDACVGRALRDLLDGDGVNPSV